MESTYSFSEIKVLIRSLDDLTLNVLEELIEEEKECFSLAELRAFNRFKQIKYKQLPHNEVKWEYFLSFN